MTGLISGSLFFESSAFFKGDSVTNLVDDSVSFFTTESVFTADSSNFVTSVLFIVGFFTIELLLSTAEILSTLSTCSIFSVTGTSAGLVIGFLNKLVLLKIPALLFKTVSLANTSI